MDTFPLEKIDLETAIQMQFQWVEAIANHFDGYSILQAGDFGLCLDTKRPHSTVKVEAVLADFFGASDACLVRGAGTGALRSILAANTKPGEHILLHQAPVYPTTKVTLDSMAVLPEWMDLNQINVEMLQSNKVQASIALVQHTRQQVADRYRLADVISVLKTHNPAMKIIVDDNYAAMRVPKIGIQSGADFSAFSLFKLLGPEGIGCVLAREGTLENIRSQAYSGGTQVQGTEAMQVLRSLVYAPVALAIQARVVDEVTMSLNSGQVNGVRRAYIASAQSRVILVELEDEIASQVLAQSISYGAAPHPVGAESRYETAPLFYRISGTFQKENPELARRLIRINPMRAGARLILSILQRSIEHCRGNQNVS